MRRLFSMIAISLTALLGNAFGQSGGHDVYIARCSSCHAPDGSGSSTVGRSLKLNDIRPAIQSMTDEQLRQIILEGRGKMPSNKKLDDEKIRRLTIFLRDLVAGHPETERSVAEANAQPLPQVDSVFRDKCSACHGADGSGRTTIGKNLHITDLVAPAVQSRNSEDLVRSIAEGKGKMPAYAKQFNPVQIGQLVSYIQSFEKSSREREPPKTEEPPAAVPQPAPSRSTPAAPRRVTSSPTPGTVDSPAPSNPSKAVKMQEPESKSAATQGSKKAPLIGKRLYGAKCFACHSSDGSGTGTVGKSMKVPSLISQQVQEKSDEALADVIRNGAGKMPSYQNKFSQEQIETLVAYIRELGGAR